MSHPARRSLRSILLFGLVAILVACSGGAAASPAASAGGGAASGSPAPSAVPSASQVPVGTIDHKTGATDVVLRFDEGGGFVPPSFFVTAVPHFTLYGDGTIIFRNPALEGPPQQGSVFLANPLRTAKLSEEQIQDLLAYALGEGGLAGARSEYLNQLVADASTAVFTIEAGGNKKTVSVYALGMDSPPAGQPGSADGPARAAFQRLAEKLTNIDANGAFPTDVYRPAAYRGVLLDGAGVVAPDIRTWPWPDITVADFVIDGDPNAVAFPHLAMTVDEVEALGVTDYEGGFQNAVVKGPDGTTYTFSLRPLLPEESQ